MLPCGTRSLSDSPDSRSAVCSVESDAKPENGARVCVYSGISGIEDNVMDSIDMMHFTADGLFLDSKDAQGTIGGP